MNLRYNMDDVQWRHVGVRNGLVYIFDLGSLDECRTSEIDVGAQVDKLKSAIRRTRMARNCAPEILFDLD